MENVTTKNYDNLIEVEQDSQISAIEAYLAKKIRLTDLKELLGLKRTQTIRKVKRFKAEGTKV